MLQEQLAFGIQLAKRKSVQMLQLQIIPTLYVLLTFQHAQSMLQVMDVQIEHVQMHQVHSFQIQIVNHIYQKAIASQRVEVDVLLILHVQQSQSKELV